MTLVNVDSVAQVYQAQVELLTVSVNDSGEFGNILVTNSDNSTILVPFTAAGSVTLTRDAIKTALEANTAVTDKYSMADVSTDGVSMTQLALTGPFTAVGNNLGGTLAITPSTTTPAAFATPRYKLDLKSPIAGSSGEIYVSRDSLRKCPGEYTLVANAITTLSAPSLLVEDTNDLLAPAPGPFSCGEYSGYMDNGLTTAKNGPEWVRDWILVKEQAETPSGTIRRVTDSDVTINTDDNTIFLTATTSVGNYDITFASGIDGQLVTLMVDAIGGTDTFDLVGVEGSTANLNSAGDSLTLRYDLTADKWRPSSSMPTTPSEPKVTTVTDSGYTVLASDEKIVLVSTTSTGNYDLTFGVGIDGQEVTVVLETISGNDKFGVLGVEEIAGFVVFGKVGDSRVITYDATSDTWRVVSSINKSSVIRVADTNYTVTKTDEVLFLDSTTSTGAYNLTFASGVDGQRVTVQLQLKSGNDGYQIVGVENINAFADYFRDVGDSMTFTYDSVDDLWRLEAMNRRGQRDIADGNGTVLKNDNLIYVSTTTSTGAYTVTFSTGEDNQKVTVVMTARDGTDDVILAGMETAVTLSAVGQVCTAIYHAALDKWFVLSQEP